MCRHERELDNATTKRVQTKLVKQEKIEGVKMKRASGKSTLHDQWGTKKADENTKKVGSEDGSDEHHKMEFEPKGGHGESINKKTTL